MKRIVSLMLILAVITIACLSCSKENGENISDREIYLFCEEEDQYQLFLERCSPMPDWFVTYDAISFLGDFCGFVLMNDVNGNNMRYYLTTNGEDEFGFYFNHESLSGTPWRKYKEPNRSFSDVLCVENNFRQIKSKSAGRESTLNGRYGFHDIVFQYNDKGLLTDIYWTYKGTLFMLFDLEYYPTDVTDTFVSRLLNPETVDVAVAEFNLRVKGY